MYTVSVCTSSKDVLILTFYAILLHFLRQAFVVQINLYVIGITGHPEDSG